MRRVRLLRRRGFGLEDPVASAVAQHLGHDVRIHVGAFVREGVDQRVVAELVDQTRRPPRGGVDHPARLVGEDPALGPRDGEAVGDVGLRLLQGQRAKMEFRGDALRELGQVRARDQLAQLRLAHEDELQQLVLVRVDVGEHPQLFERLRRQVLRLVEDQRGASAGGVFLDQEVLELPEELHVGLRRVGLLPQRHKHPMQQLAAPALGVRDQPDAVVLRDLVEQLAHQRRLAGADLAGDDRDRRMGGDAVFQHRVGLGVRRRPVEELGVGQQRERPLGEAEERIVHLRQITHPPIRLSRRPCAAFRSPLCPPRSPDGAAPR